MQYRYFHDFHLDVSKLKPGVKMICKMLHERLLSFNSIGTGFGIKSKSGKTFFFFSFGFTL